MKKRGMFLFHSLSSFSLSPLRESEGRRDESGLQWADTHFWSLLHQNQMGCPSTQTEGWWRRWKGRHCADINTHRYTQTEPGEKKGKRECTQKIEHVPGDTAEDRKFGVHAHTGSISNHINMSNYCSLWHKHIHRRAEWDPSSLSLVIPSWWVGDSRGGWVGPLQIYLKPARLREPQCSRWLSVWLTPTVKTNIIMVDGGKHELSSGQSTPCTISWINYQTPFVLLLLSLLLSKPTFMCHRLFSLRFSALTLPPCFTDTVMNASTVFGRILLALVGPHEKRRQSRNLSLPCFMFLRRVALSASGNLLLWHDIISCQD